MRIALANAQYHEGNNLFPPLGLLYVAGALRGAGHRVMVLDGDPLVETDMIGRIVEFRPDLVGLSFLTMTYGRARALARGLRAQLDAPLMIGGPHVTAEPERSLRDLGADVAVVGEGERTAVAVARRLAAGGDPSDIAGVVTPRGRGPAREPIADLDELSLPARDLIDHERYLSSPGLIRGWASSRHASVMAGRGCRYRCTFCASHLQLGRDLRMRSVADVLAELDHLVARYRVRGVYWVDDIFTGDKPWVRRFCAALAERPYRLEWGCQSRVEAIDPDLLDRMRAAGCCQIDFGVESGATDVLRRMKKGTTPRSVMRAFEMVRSAGVRAGASFIIGSPGETAEDIQTTIDLSERIAADWTVFFFSTPYPGSDLWQEVREASLGDELPAYGEDWNNRRSQRPLCPGSLPVGELIRYRASAQNRHFARNYLRPRNLLYAAHLATASLAELPEVAAALRGAMRTRRWDDLVEAAFAAHRSRIVGRRPAPGWFGQGMVG